MNYNFRVRTGKLDTVVSAKTHLDASILAFGEVKKKKLNKLGLLTECHKEFDSFNDIMYIKTEYVLEKMKTTFVED